MRTTFRSWWPTLILMSANFAFAQAQQYDLLFQGGHVIDAKNSIDGVRDVAIRDGKIALVAQRIDPAQAFKVVNVRGLYVTPGLIDIHVHVYAGTGEPRSYVGDSSLYPDGYTLRSGVTTAADAGCAGWRNFEDFKQRIIDRAKTRILAFINIVGNGMRGSKYENDLTDMQAGPTAEMALKYKGLIIGVKTAHFPGPEWTPVEQAVEAGTIANIPVMVDFGSNRKERPLSELVTKKLRPGDIYTHCYSGLRGELDDSGHVNPAMFEGRRRGVIFDVGHGGGSFAWRVAVPALRQGFRPDSLSTDLHIDSMNSGLKDMDNLMSKFLVLGVPLKEVVADSTWNPAREIHREDLGNLSPGSVADVAILRLERGDFGYTDGYGGRLKGHQRLTCQLTLREGKVVWDLEGITRPDWTTLPPGYKQSGDPRWDSINVPVRRRDTKQ
jgi:dihydroorotase